MSHPLNGSKTWSLVTKLLNYHHMVEDINSHRQTQLASSSTTTVVTGKTSGWTFGPKGKPLGGELENSRKRYNIVARPLVGSEPKQMSSNLPCVQDKHFAVQTKWIEKSSIKATLELVPIKLSQIISGSYSNVPTDLAGPMIYVIKLGQEKPSYPMLLAQTIT